MSRNSRYRAIEDDVGGTPIELTHSMRRGLRGCSLKRCHKTKARAKMAARKTGSRYGTITSVYRCRYCGMWHVATRRRR